MSGVGRYETSAQASEVRKVHRVNVNFSEGAWIELQALAAVRDRSISEVIRSAISLEKWYQDVLDSGGRLLVERNGQVREVIFR